MIVPEKQSLPRAKHAKRRNKEFVLKNIIIIIIIIIINQLSKIRQI